MFKIPSRTGMESFRMGSQSFQFPKRFSRVELLNSTPPYLYNYILDEGLSSISPKYIIVTIFHGCFLSMFHIFFSARLFPVYDPISLT